MFEGPHPRRAATSVPPPSPSSSSSPTTPTRPPSSRSGGRKLAPHQCPNCGANETETKMWRKCKVTGAKVCNSCGLYSATNGVVRPSHLWARERAPSSSKRGPPLIKGGKRQQSEGPIKVQVDAPPTPKRRRTAGGERTGKKGLDARGLLEVSDGGEDKEAEAAARVLLSLKQGKTVKPNHSLLDTRPSFYYNRPLKKRLTTLDFAFSGALSTCPISPLILTPLQPSPSLSDPSIMLEADWATSPHSTSSDDPWVQGGC